jgi:uncharacterized protein (DUF2141 family)
MRRSVSAFTISLTFLTWLLSVAPALAQQAETNNFELSGNVINAATGEPVSRALVQMQTPVGKAQFAGTDGTFVFKNLARGRYNLTASKPGFFNEQQLGRWNAWMNSFQDVPSEKEVVLKLTPEGIIYGEVKNENGEPIEGVTVRAQRWQTENGRKSLQNARDAATDDEGNFRLAELKPGSYHLSFVPVGRGGWVTYDKLNRKKQTDEGYGAQFYPGVADVESSTAIELRGGATVHITQALSRQRLFEVAGAVRGVNPTGGFGLMLVNTSGDMVQRTVRIDPKTGQFQIPGVPAGTYMLVASAQAPNENGTQEPQAQLTATQLIHLKSDLGGVVLMLGRGISVGVQVNGGIPSVGTANVPQVMVQLISREFLQNSRGTMVPPQNGEPRPAARIEDIPPGTYTVEASPNQPAYIASLRCGSVDLLRDDLTIAPGGVLPPIEVTLGKDGAQLSVKVMEKGQPAAAAVVIYSEEYPRRSVLTQTNETGAFSQGNLAPGKYQVIAVKDALDLEFRSPGAMEKYLEHASAVTLQSGGAETSVRVEVQELPERHR